jgi:predicted nucleic acid-binding protein
MILLDTNIWIDYFRGKPQTIRFIDAQPKNSIAICSVIAMELYKGSLNKAEFEKIKKTLKGLLMIDLNENISKVALQLSEQYALSHNMAVPDTLIAATALVFDLELITHNIKDFQFIPTLKVHNNLE